MKNNVQDLKKRNRDNKVISSPGNYRNSNIEKRIGNHKSKN